jgi:hypothetical protein
MPCHAMLHAGHVVILPPGIGHRDSCGGDEFRDSDAQDTATRPIESAKAPDHAEFTFLLGTRRERYVGEQRIALHVVT